LQDDALAVKKFAHRKALWRASFENEMANPSATKAKYQHLALAVGPYTNVEVIVRNIAVSDHLAVLGYGPLNTVELLHQVCLDGNRAFERENAYGHFWVLNRLETPAHPAIFITAPHTNLETTYVNCPDF
jgi:hypothetical protein